VLESQNMVVVRKFIQEAIDENFKLVMDSAGMVSMARMMIDANSNVEIGTVIDFPEEVRLG
jgi:deoxyribose-phosphate aldolase